MFTKSQLDQLEKLLESNNKKIIKGIYGEIKTTEEKLGHEIQQTEIKLRHEIQTSNQQLEDKLSLKIIASQEDTVDAVSDIINTGFNMHEMRIKRIEKHLNLPPIRQ